MDRFARTFWIACIFSVAAGVATANADGLENGDFSHGKSKWTGEGVVVFLKADGTITATDDSKPGGLPKPADPANPDQKAASTQIIELKSHPSQFADMSASAVRTQAQGSDNSGGFAARRRV